MEHCARVLIVETDRSLSALVAEWLVLAGYDAALARNAATTPPGAPPEVILLDIPAPTRAARALIAGVRARFPDAPVIAMSGNIVASGAAAADAFAAELGAAAVLPKPFGRDALLKAIDRVRAAH